MKVIYNVPQLASILQISKSTLYKKVEHGSIPFFKVGSHIRFLEDEISDYINKTIYDQRNKNESQWKF